MGKKNIKPLLNQPVIRQNVAKPALEGLTEENLTTTTGTTADAGVSPRSQELDQCLIGCVYMTMCTCSYDDDAE